LLTAHGHEPGRAQLNNAENFVRSPTPGATAVLHQFETLVGRLAIDDVGTGYSSLSYLKRLPLHILKIDQSFVRGLPEDTHDAAIVRAIIALGRSLQLTVIAQGVANSEQQRFQHRHGCAQIQGYMASLPLDAAECRERFRSKAP
ncbi:EAL domain-containing protein, partial [Pseudomonas syringae]